ncbi:MAG: phosphonopyruvate decarboxylase [Saccharofermentanales bacterium]
MKLDFLKEHEFFTGVPDSQLKPLCDYLMKTYGICRNHIIAANEGNCVALAAGYHLATGKVPVVYLQNSGIGNIINPVASLMNDKVYGIPCIFIIGWRGEPGLHDEPQHLYQGEVTIKLLEDMDIKTFIISKDTTVDDVVRKLSSWQKVLNSGKQVAFIVRKGALEFDEEVLYDNENKLSREEIIEEIVKISGEDPIVSTTGKGSRELFEIRERNDQSHRFDFLTVGSMGHSSSIALGIAMQRPDKTVWCIDGDGAVLMHMGAMATIGSTGLKNMIHLVINNSAHESVGGMPTVASKIDLVGIASACGYDYSVCVATPEELEYELQKAKDRRKLSFIEVKCSLYSRTELGRPTTTAKANKESFMDNLI